LVFESVQESTSKVLPKRWLEAMSEHKSVFCTIKTDNHLHDRDRNFPLGHVQGGVIFSNLLLIKWDTVFEVRYSYLVLRMRKPDIMVV